MLTLLLACSGSDLDTAAEAPPAPDQVGPHTAATDLTEAPGPDGITLPVQLWYPSKTGDTSPYSYDNWFEGTAVDGDPDCSETRPVVIFSHGNTGLRYQSIFLTERLATHGYVVAAPDHVGNTFFDDSLVSLQDLIFRRPLDIAAVFDALVADESLDGCIDPDAGYAVIGHSFGGYTSIALAGAVIDRDASDELCSTSSDAYWLCEDTRTWFEENGTSVADLHDERVWAAVPQAPAGYEVLVGGLDQVDVPMLVMGGQKDKICPMSWEVEPIYEGLTAPTRYLGELEGADHFDFSDACVIVESYPGCGDSPIDLQEAHELINASTVAFLGGVRGLEYGEWMPYDDDLWTWDSP